MSVADPVTFTMPTFTAKRIADIQRKHNVRLKVAFRAGHWECTVVRAGAEDDYFGGSRCDLADLLDRVVLDLEREP